MTPKASKTIKAGEFKARCLQLMDDVAASGESVVITKRGKPVARLAPIVDRSHALVGFLAGTFTHVGDVVSPVDVEWGPAEAVVTPRRSR